MTRFIYYIENYNRTINYNMAYGEIAYKYFLRPFIVKLIRKSMSGRFYSIIYIILIGKVVKSTKKKFGISNAKVIQIYNAINILLKYH